MHTDEPKFLRTVSFRVYLRLIYALNFDQSPQIAKVAPTV